MKKTGLFFIIFILFVSCNSKPNSHFNNIKTESTKIPQPPLVLLPETEELKQIEQPKKETFDNTIFAGLKLGMDEKTVNEKLKSYKKHYSDKILVEQSENIRAIIVTKITPYFYKNELYKLQLKFEDRDAFGLKDLFISKYGESSSEFSCYWQYQNAEISFFEHSRREYEGSTYKRHTGMYYNEAGGLTKKSCYSTITYTDIHRLSDKMKYDRMKKAQEDSVKLDNLNREKIEMIKIIQEQQSLI